MNRFMMIVPKSKKRENVEDELTWRAEKLMSKIKGTGKFFKGFHVCKCGAASGSEEMKIGQYETNSLMAHYVREHRSEVPQEEIDKLNFLYEKYFLKPQLKHKF